MARTWAVWVLLLAPLTGWAQPAPELVSFDGGALELRRVRDRWHIQCGLTTIKDLGTSEVDARAALRIIRDLRLTQRGTIGKPQPVLEYWLADHQPPVGFLSRYRLGRIDLPSLRIDSCFHQWCLRDANQVLFAFGPHQQEAQKALDLLQRYQFNRVGYVGSGTPVLMFFVSVTESGPGARNKPEPIVAQPPLTLASFLQTRQLASVNPLSWDTATGGERQSLDWRQAQVRLEGKRWKLCLGSACLADFGSDNCAAREALRVVQYYRFTDQCRLGDPARPFIFYLVQGEAPQGTCLGIPRLALQPEQLSVRRQGEGSDWLLCEGERPLLRVGSSAEEAGQVLKAIQYYKFDTLLRVGNSDAEGAVFLVKQR